MEKSAVCVQGSSRAPQLIPEWRFDVADLTPNQRVEAWHEACSGFYDVTIDVDVVTAVAQATFSWHRLAGLMFSSGVSYPHVARRNANHVRLQKNFVRLLFSREGGSRILTGEQCWDLGADAIHLIDYSRPYVHLRTDSIDLNGVYVPHEAIGYDPSRQPPYMRIGMETPAGQVLAGAFFALSGQLPVLEMSEAPALATGMSDLVRALVLRDLESERGLAVVRAARREAMCAFIERHLHDPSLGIESLQRRFGASRATVYRDFEAVGGVANHVMNRRLERALADLIDCGPTRGAVTAISERWGFETLSHFSRRFRERFGVAPSEFSGLGGAANPVDGDAATSLWKGATSLDGRGNLSSWFAIQD